MKEDNEFWYGIRDDETVNATSLEDCIQDYVECWDEDETIPEKVDVIKFARQGLQESCFEVLDDLLERLAEEFQNPDDDKVDPLTEAMKEAEKAFMAVMKKEYKNYWLTEVGKIPVNIHEWMIQNGYGEELKKK